jgi:dTDP-4-amino-4,6-dideoxygalactose transaminase
VHDTLGTNLRMTEMQAAIGRIQLRRLPEWVEQRRQNAATLAARLGEIETLRVPQPASDRIHHSYYKYYAFVRPEALRSDWSRDRIVAEVLDRRIPCGSGICPEVYREGAFRESEYSPETRLPVAAELGATSLMFPVHPTLTCDDMHGIADVVTSIVANATR